MLHVFCLSKLLLIIQILLPITGSQQQEPGGLGRGLQWAVTLSGGEGTGEHKACSHHHSNDRDQRFSLLHHLHQLQAAHGLAMHLSGPITQEIYMCNKKPLS